MPPDLRPRPQRTPHSPLWHLNTALARPIAWAFGVLGVGPGQLSLQSVTLTAVGLLRAASGDWPHVAQGVLVCYAGFLVDRADDLLPSHGKPATAWSRFLGLMADRVVDAALVVSLGWLALSADAGWQPLGRPAFLVVVAAAAACILLARLASVYGDLLILRIHLATARRLPGPSAIPRGPQAEPWLSRLLDRDLSVLVWAVGAATLQVQLAAFVLLGTQALVALEGFALFFARRRDPEPHAVQVLARGP